MRRAVHGWPSRKLRAENAGDGGRETNAEGTTLSISGNGALGGAFFVRRFLVGLVVGWSIGNASEAGAAVWLRQGVTGWHELVKAFVRSVLDGDWGAPVEGGGCSSDFTAWLVSRGMVFSAGVQLHGVCVYVSEGSEEGKKEANE